MTDANPYEMYLEAVALSALQIGASFALESVGSLQLERFGNIALAAFVGSLGVGLYQRRARIAVAAARRAEPDLERRLARLRKKGGTNLVGPVIVGGLLLAMLFRGMGVL
jgi:hypothetical protein